MIILGIDPGFADMGYGVVQLEKGNYSLVDYGVLTTGKQESVPVRLKIIYDGVSALLDKFKPEAVAVEQLYFFKNQKTVITVAEARGAILVALIEKCGRIYEYTPLQVKMALTGYGRAEKGQIQQMVKTLLKLKEIPRPDDAADALAVALTCAHTIRI